MSNANLNNQGTTTSNSNLPVYDRLKEKCSLIRKEKRKWDTLKRAWIIAKGMNVDFNLDKAMDAQLDLVSGMRLILIKEAAVACANNQLDLYDLELIIRNML